MIGELNLTNLDEEKAHYLSKVNQDPQDDASWFKLALIYDRLRQIDLAKKSYKKALQVETKPEYHLKLGEHYYVNKDYSKALHHLLESSKMIDEDWDHYPLLDELIQDIYRYDHC